MAALYTRLVDTQNQLLENIKANWLLVMVAEGHLFKCCGEMGMVDVTG